jgi:hypothetical protein
MDRSTTNDAIVMSGLAEVALGALTGWPFSLAVSNPQRARELGIRSTPRLRQWHLDLIALGSLQALAGSAVPNLPRKVAWPLMVGAWTNANAFAPLVARPELKDHPAYKAAAVASFVTTTWGFAGLATVAARRALGRRSRQR